MNYGQLKDIIRDSGFGDDEEIAEFGDIVPNNINRAITEINLNVSPIIGVYEIEQDGSTDNLLYYDIEELTKEGGKVVFLEFADTPVMVGDTAYEKFNDFEIENEKTLVMFGRIKGKFKVFYKKAHTPFTLNTPNETELELPLKAHILVPLLASYYIWLEDEKAKAVDYYNQYERLVNEMKAKTPIRMRIISGGM